MGLLLGHDPTSAMAGMGGGAAGGQPQPGMGGPGAAAGNPPPGEIHRSATAQEHHTPSRQQTHHATQLAERVGDPT